MALTSFWGHQPSNVVREGRKRTLRNAGLCKIEATFDTGELGGTAADIDHGACFEVLVELCPK